MSENAIPYGRQFVDDDDARAVLDVLRSDWLTTGPAVSGLEAALCKRTEAAAAAAVSSGTAALHLAYMALDLGPGDELLTTPLTFAATATAALAVGATVRFADVHEDTGLIDETTLELSNRTKIISVVDYAGCPVDVEAVVRHAPNLPIVVDAAHSLGATQRDVPVGQQGTLTTLSFHPVKAVTTAEGGAVVGNHELVERVRQLRSHGMVKNEMSAREGPWAYEIHELGFNYRVSDLQCALGISQLRKLDKFLARRRAIAAVYNDALADVAGLKLPVIPPDTVSAWHLYVVRVRDPKKRRALFEALHTRGIRVQVHYLPVYWHPLFQRLGFERGLCPRAERFYQQAISLPIYPGLNDEQLAHCVEVIREQARRLL